MITLADYYMGRDRAHGHLLGSDLRANAARTVETANADTVLRDLALWLEHPASTKGWAHVQLRPPRSGRRVFYP
jgi:hypothetical protein